MYQNIKLSLTKLLYTVAGLLILACPLQGQVFETELSSEEMSSEQSILDQASASFTGTSPFITLKTYKLKGLIGKGHWDLYLFNTVPTFSIKRQDSLQVFAEDILNQLGGLLNFSMSKVGYFASNKDKSNRDIKGGKIDFRFGGKLLDSHNREADSKFIVPVFQSTFDVTYLIPLLAPEAEEKEGKELKKSIKGNLSFRLYGGFMQIFNTTIYDQYYSSDRGVPPTHSVLTGSGEINLFISNQFYLSAGYTISNQRTLPNRPFFSISYTGQGE